MASGLQGQKLFCNVTSGTRNVLGDNLVGKRKKRHSLEWRLPACTGHWPPSIGRAVVLSTARSQASRLAPPFEGRSLAVAPAGRPVWFWLTRFPARPIHHWHSLISNHDSVWNGYIFLSLTVNNETCRLDYGNKNATIIPKSVVAQSALPAHYRWQIGQ